jgi:adenosylcobinamide-phosphate synthase
VNIDIYTVLYQFFCSRPGVVCTVTLLAMMIPVSSNICCLLFTRIADRLNSGDLHPATAGMFSILANLVIFLPLLALLWCMNNLLPHEIIYDYLLMLFCIEYSSVRSSVTDVSFQLRKEQLKKARRAAGFLLLRSTDTLSEMGVAKAVCESVVLHFLHGFFVPVFWYLLLGPTAAFISVLLVILSRAFSIKLRKNEYFGRVNSVLAKTVSAIPALVMYAMLFFVTLNFNAFGRAVTHMRFHPCRLSGLLIGFTAEHLNISLGGPRIYQDEKIRYNRIGGKTDPAPVHVDRSYRMSRNSVLLSSACLLTYQLLHILI